ncbi:MAG: AprI/Inh family metalloprotease inhibitor [Hyphomicrobiaceae bacterium]|nr:AprI/Inh family metalloprotease inhibitor [Hyphomicrobiaceae bacterium]MCC0024320.1 AprI/Inh family metalloprotease inhibitor [Hyphomicrobiaceae bacterium]
MKFQHSFKYAALVVAGLALTGCSNSARFSDYGPPPEQLTPLANSSVQRSSLPPLNGAQTQNGGYQVNPDGSFTAYPTDGLISGDPLIDNQQPGTSVITADATGNLTTTQTRDLTGALTETKMLGGWTVISGAATCQINLTQTAKPGTNRYRASAPGCTAIPVLGQLASWQLAGSQVQFFSESGQLMATLLKSGNRFIGSLSGGQGISMVG